jgi:hypothetical protein
MSTLPHTVSFTLSLPICERIKLFLFDYNKENGTNFKYLNNDSINQGCVYIDSVNYKHGHDLLDDLFDNGLNDLLEDIHDRINSKEFDDENTFRILNA